MIRLILLLLTTLVLSACGGGAGSNSSTSNSGNDDSNTQTPPSDPTPTPTGYSVIDFDFKQQSNNRQYRGTEVQSEQFSNATGQFLLPLVGQDLSGNITIGISVSDPDNLNGIVLAFTGSTRAISLCAANCGQSYSRVITGVNPLDFDLTSGDQRLELWVNDTAGNQVLVNTVEFDWQATVITGVSATRNSNTINLSWNGLSNYLRYNVYVASEPNVGPDNYQNLAGGEAFFAQRNPSIALSGKEDSRTFYTMVTGIDGSGESAFANQLNVMAVAGAIDLPPTAVNDAFSVDEDQTLTGNLIANDSDLESGAVTINTAPLSLPENGSVTINADGTFSYQPISNFNGRDAFAYQVSDGLGQIDSAFVIITVNPINDAPQPILNNYNVSTAAQQRASNNGVLSVSSPGLLINDLDIDSNNLTVDTTPITPPNKGTLTLNADGSFIYTVGEGQTGEDSFTYRTIDNNGASNQTTVTITIDGNNFPPVAANDVYQLLEDQTFVTDASSTSRLSVLANDSDQDQGDVLSLITNLVQGVSHGTLNIGTDGNFTYIPNAGYYGTDSFIYQIADGNGGVAQAAVILQVGKRNNAPTVANDSYQAQEDTILTVNASDGVLSNDSDQDFDTLVVATELVEQAPNGSVTMTANGSFSYQPNENFFGTDTFRYQVSDSEGESSIGTVTINVANVNDAPVANDDIAQTTTNSEIAIPVLENDTDIDGDTIIITTATIDQSIGSAVIDNDASIVFIPATGFEGFAEITYTISDGNGGSGSALVRVAVNIANNPPVAVNDNYTINEDGRLNANGSDAPTLLSNDSDSDGDNLEVLIAVSSNVSNGSLTLAADGTFVYLPNENFFGTDQFSYQITDNRGGTDTATATITVQSVNDVPQAQDDQIATAEETLINIDVLANDSDADNDPLTITSANAENGSIEITADNSINYTPTLNFFGTDQINYQISDGNQGSASATVFVTIANVNDNPVALDDQATTNQGEAVDINVVANDSDVDGDTLQVVSATANNGSVEIINSQQIRYTPAATFSATDTISYVVGDGNGGSATANVFVSISENNQPPQANDDSATLDEDNSLDINVTANDSDPNGDDLTVITASVDVGQVSVINSSSVRFTPPQNYNGNAVINYTVSDNRGGEDSATVALTIRPVNDAPTVQNEQVNVNENTTAEIDVLSNDSDIDGDQISLIGAGSSNGSVVISVNQTIIYQPNTNFDGSDTIDYTVSDPNGLTAIGQVFVTVLDTNPNPIAVDDSFTIKGDSPVNINPLLNDSSPSGSALTIVNASAQVGSAQINQGQFITYQAPQNFVGSDQIAYTISDNSGQTATATIFITVEASENQAPVAVNDNVNTNRNAAITINALANDSDPDGDPLTITAATASQGSANISDNRVNYQPPRDFVGVDTINYQISDSNGAIASATITVNVIEFNQAPIANPDSATTDEDQSIIIDAIANDSDPDQDSIAITLANADNGAVTVVNNKLNFVPTENFNGQAQIQYTIADSFGATASSTVTVTINPINDAPLAANDQSQVDEDNQIVINVLENDSDIDSDSLTITQASAENGTVSINEGQSLTYQGNKDFNGTDTISYTVADPQQASSQATVTVTINPINDAPVANQDTVQTNEEITTIIKVLENDLDVDGDTLTVTAANADKGTVTILSDNSLEYQPPKDYIGNAQIDYQISDGNLSAASIVTIEIFETNDNPVANPDTATTDEDTLVTIDAIANDTDVDSETLTITEAKAENGTTTITDNKIVYTPKQDFNGEDIISYTISDGEAGSAQSNVTVTINAINDLPIAGNDTANTNEDTTVTIDVLSNDSDVDGDTLTITIEQTSSGGSSVTSDNQIQYTPAANESGEAQIVYIVSDGQGGNDSAIVTVTINPVNDAPTALPDSAITEEDQSVLIDVLANDSDIENDSLSISVLGVTIGSAAVENNQLRYTPNANYNGTSTVTYQVSDNAGGLSQADVTIVVVAVNDPPVAQNDTSTTNEDTSVTIDVLANDSDIDNDSLSVLAANASNGAVTINSDSTLTYVPSNNFNGQDTIDYLITDNQGATAGAQVAITINAVNDEPTAIADQFSINEDVTSELDVLANDSDIDSNDTLNIVTATADSGTVTIGSNDNGPVLTYLSANNFNGTVTINYTISDNNCVSDTSCTSDRYASTTATVIVSAVNDTPTATDATVEIAENVNNGHSVHTVVATDVDQDTLTYSISAGNNGNVFAINATSGEITVADKSGLNASNTPQYTLTIAVTDTQLASAFAQITVNVSKVSGNQTLITDTSFGDTDIPGISLANAFSFDNRDDAHAAVIDSNGRIIIAGSVTNTKSDIAMARYLSDGSLDHTFGTQGVFIYTTSTFQSITAAAVDSSNNVYLVGEQFDDSTGQIDIVLAKITSSGVLDTGFGSSGIVTTNLGINNMQVSDLLVHSNSNLYVSASVNNQFAIYQFAQSSGSLVNSAQLDINGDFEVVMSIAEQSDGKILLAGHTADSNNDFNYDYTVIRIDQSTLALDTSFATNGQVQFDLGRVADDFVHDMLVSSDDSIVLVGATAYGSNIYDVALAQMDSNGALNGNIGSTANPGIMIIDADGDNQTQTASSKAMNVTLHNNNLYLGIEIEDSSFEAQVGVIKILSGGSLDSSFGSNGISTVNLASGQENLAATLIDSNNQPILAASAIGTRNQDFVLARLTTQGSLDTNFATNGSNFSNLTPSTDALKHGIPLTNGNQAGKIVMAGSSLSNTSVTDAVVARYSSNGALDTSFGDDGYWRLTNNNSNAVIVQSVAELSDGRLVVGGSNGDSAFIALLNEQGQLDTSFDSDGIKLFDASSNNLQLAISTVAIHNNLITFAGSARDISNDGLDIYLGRITVNGSFDTSFGSSGEVLSNLGQNEVANNMVVLSDGAVLIAGSQTTTTGATDSRALVAKYTSSGSLDSSFNSGYHALDVDSSVSDNQDQLFDIEVDSSGIIYASGRSQSSTTDLQVLVSIAASGSLNSQFGTSGIGLYQFGISSDSPSLTIDNNQKPLLTGLANNSTDGGTDVFIARFATDGQIDPLFNSGNAYITSYGVSDDVSLIINLSSTSLLIAGDYQVTAFNINAAAWYMHKLTLIEN